MGVLSDLWKGFIDWLLPSQDPAGIYVQKTGTNQHIPVVYGERKVAGITVFKRSSDRDGGPWNDYLHIVLVLCEGEVEEIGEVFFNDVSQYDSRWGSEWYHIERFTGADNQSACQTLINHNVGWTNTDKLSGLAYIYVRLRQNDDVNKWRGEPKITAVVKGKKVKNLDTGVVAYSDNYAWCIADYLTRPRYGRGVSEINLRTDTFINAANFFDTTVNATENQEIIDIQNIADVVPNWENVDWFQFGRWGDLGYGSLTNTTLNTLAINKKIMTCNVVLDTSKTVFDNLKILLSGCRGLMPDTSGPISLYVEKDGAPVATFSEDQIIGGIDVDIKGRKDRANQVEVTFANKALNYEMDSVVYPESGSAKHSQWLSDDHNVDLPYQVELPTIDNKSEALQMAMVIAELSRDFFEIEFRTDKTTWRVEAGDIVAINDEDHGFVNKPFRILATSPKENGEIRYKAIEHQDNIYPWADHEYDQSYPKTTLGNPFDLFPPTGVGASYSGDELRIFWYRSPDRNVDGYIIRLYDNDHADKLIREYESNTDHLLINGLATGTYRVEVFAYSAIGLSQGVSKTLYIDTGIIFPEYVGTSFRDIHFTPNDIRVWAFRNMLQFWYSETNYGATPDTVNAINGGVGGTLIINDADENTVYYVWYSGDGTTWYKALISAGSGIPQGHLEQTLQDRLDALGEIVDPTLDLVEIQEDVDQLNEDVDEVIDSIIWESALSQEHQTEQTLNKASTQRNEEAIADTEGARAQMAIQLTAAVDDLTATITRVDNVEVTVGGNSTAISALEGTVNNPVSGMTATYNTASQAKTTADGAASSITALQNTVNNPTTGLSATALLAQEAKTDAAGNTTAITSLQASIDALNDGQLTEAEVALTLGVHRGELDTLNAQFYLGADVNGRITGVKGSVNDSIGTLDFIGDAVQFVRQSDLSVAFRWDATLDDFIFDGTIYAANIEGDVVDAYAADINPAVYDGSGNQVARFTFLQFTVASQPFDRYVYVSPLPIRFGDLPSIYLNALANGQTTNVRGVSGQVAGGDVPSGFTFFQPKNTTVSYEIYANANTNLGTAVVEGDVLIQVFKSGSTITIN